jgi:hypothetical protein
MENHAKPRHRCRNALGSSHFSETPRSDVVRCGDLAFQQHRAKHVLRWTVILIGGGAVKFHRTRIVLLDALSLVVESCAVALTDAIAARSRER